MSEIIEQRVEESLRRLKLHRICRNLTSYTEQASKEELSYLEFLDRILQEEIERKYEKYVELRTSMAHFPFKKSLEEFDFTFQPSIPEKKIKELSQSRYTENGENIIFLGPPGVGKTHLSSGLGKKAIEKGYKTLFVSAASLINDLSKANEERRLESRLKFYSQMRLLIVDEIGYRPIDRYGANLFFQLISQRYEKGSGIFTSNQSFSHWGEIFSDDVIASEILDRLLHHSVSINIKGESYRLREKRKAGFFKRESNEEHV